ncbi:MAG: hypothetical protein A2X49_09360 [Lentisphaerae bacterium GWF2_52_8]|nr:MAG: hypothetical protein A2X49_09360 [Lentisphaerae bacterium GWF2_52_8]
MTIQMGDIIAEASFIPAEYGGRKDATPSGFFGCPFLFNGKLYDCRLLLDKTGLLQPGMTAIVPIKFLNPSIILPFIKTGDVFGLWEIRMIAYGKVISVSTI